MTDRTLVAFDLSLMRPACVLVAASLGADTRAAARFPVDSWLLAPTDGMEVFPTTPEQLDKVVAKVEETFH